MRKLLSIVIIIGLITSSCSYRAGVTLTVKNSGTQPVSMTKAIIGPDRKILKEGKDFVILKHFSFKIEKKIKDFKEARFEVDLAKRLSLIIENEGGDGIINLEIMTPRGILSKKKVGVVLKEQLKRETKTTSEAMIELLAFLIPMSLIGSIPYLIGVSDPYLGLGVGVIAGFLSRAMVKAKIIGTKVELVVEGDVVKFTNQEPRQESQSQ